MRLDARREKVRLTRLCDREKKILRPFCGSCDGGSRTRLLLFGNPSCFCSFHGSFSFVSLIVFPFKDASLRSSVEKERRPNGYLFSNRIEVMGVALMTIRFAVSAGGFRYVGV